MASSSEHRNANTRNSLYDDLEPIAEMREIQGDLCIYFRPVTTTEQEFGDRHSDDDSVAKIKPAPSGTDTSVEEERIEELISDLSASRGYRVKDDGEIRRSSTKPRAEDQDLSRSQGSRKENGKRHTRQYDHGRKLGLDEQNVILDNVGSASPPSTTTSPKAVAFIEPSMIPRPLKVPPMETLPPSDDLDLKRSSHIQGRTGNRGPPRSSKIFVAREEQIHAPRQPFNSMSPEARFLKLRDHQAPSVSDSPKIPSPSSPTIQDLRTSQEHSNSRSQETYCPSPSPSASNSTSPSSLDSEARTLVPSEPTETKYVFLSAAELAAIVRANSSNQEPTSKVKKGPSRSKKMTEDFKKNSEEQYRKERDEMMENIRARTAKMYVHPAERDTVTERRMELSTENPSEKSKKANKFVRAMEAYNKHVEGLRMIQ